MDAGDLHPIEAAHAETLPSHRCLAFVGGRLAIRRSLRALGASSTASALPVLPGEHGAPVLPIGFMGSISHTHGLA